MLSRSSSGSSSLERRSRLSLNRKRKQPLPSSRPSGCSASQGASLADPGSPIQGTGCQLLFAADDSIVSEVEETNHTPPGILWITSRLPSTVLRIRIHRIPFSLGSPGSVITRYGVRILLLSSKNRKKNLDSYCFVISFGLFIFEKWCKCTSKE